MGTFPWRKEKEKPFTYVEVPLWVGSCKVWEQTWVTLPQEDPLVLDEAKKNSRRAL